MAEAPATCVEHVDALGLVLQLKMGFGVLLVQTPAAVQVVVMLLALVCVNR